MRTLLALPALLLLAACSEQQMCISRATQDLRAVRSFVNEAEGNLARGYALVETEVVDYERKQCGETPNGDTKYCRVAVKDTVIKRKSIDLDGEAAKLAVLREKEAALAIQAEAQVLACQQAYPD
ncbi:MULTISPECIES: hypothetical protein [Pacificibacter]|uniref:hypothetical protein n=1 Tax=Pacificibacter TaxID=1042323 RepID=UPI001C09EA4A|nr:MULTISPECIES: hypothetical protein [Pacificibacter]MBU2937820.1 hypothetical protein [Pacificibacter marinus]MDO6616081.1 hypothetical protein [Pacificibacter sp. 1_MG-2023]